MKPMTNCPGLIEVAALPTSSTMPQLSCPIGVGWVIGLMPRQGHRSHPQKQVAEIQMTASVGFGGRCRHVGKQVFSDTFTPPD